MEQYNYILPGIPKEPGWYWWRESDHKTYNWIPRLIIIDKDGQYYVYIRNEEQEITILYELNSYGGEWWSERLDPPPKLSRKWKKNDAGYRFENDDQTTD